MKNTFLSAAGLLTLAALASCETVVDLPEPAHTPRVALMYTLTPEPADSSFLDLYLRRQMFVSNSQRVFDTSDLTGRADARVELRAANGQVLERYRALLADPNYGVPGSYRPTLGYRPQPGQTYTLHAELPGLEAAESQLTMPQPAQIESVIYAARDPGPDAQPGEYRGRLSLSVRDDPGAANYYLAYARVLDQQGEPANWSAATQERDDDDVANVGQFELSTPGSDYDIYPFADTDVNGQRITLTADVQFYNRDCYQGNCLPPGYLEVYVTTITPEMYNFYLLRRRYYDSDGNPFAEPSRLASNVRPGYGLFGGATDAKFRIRIP